jgi:predicted PurR-regulated permease PerM
MLVNRQAAFWLAALFCLVCQFLEGYVPAPHMVGRVVGLHPVWLLFALFAFGYWFGVVGLLLAIPMAAAVGVLARFGLRRYLASPLYTGDDPGTTTGIGFGSSFGSAREPRPGPP